MTDRRRCCAGVLVTLLLLSGCSATPGRGPTNDEPATVTSSRASIDFRSMPTRADVGMGSSGYATYPKKSGSAPVKTTLTFPTGTVRRDFFQINIGTNYAFAPDENPEHQPTDYEFFLKAKDIDQARSFLAEDAQALGLSKAVVDDVTAEGTSVEQGYVRGSLSTEVEVRSTGSGDGSLNIICSASFGRYHNEAVDQILENGVVSLDLTQPPTRAGLGILPAYDTADIPVEPGKKLSLRALASRGTVELPLDSLGSNVSDRRPGTTIASAVTSTAELQAALQRSATALGIDPAKTKSFFGGAGKDLSTRNLTCAETDVYSCDLRLQATTSEGAQYAASYRLTLTYR